MVNFGKREKLQILGGKMKNLPKKIKHLHLIMADMIWGSNHLKMNIYAKVLMFPTMSIFFNKTCPYKWIFFENNIEFDFINDKTTFDPDVIHKLKY